MNSNFLTANVSLENERVLLVPFTDSRNEQLKDIIFDESIWTYMGLYIRSSKDLEQYIENTIASKLNRICYAFLIVDKLSNKVAGSTRYGNLNIASKKCEIGWTWLGKEFQGTGLNKACKYELLKYGFEDIGFNRIQFSTDTRNVRSQKAIQKLGASKEGVFRNNYVDSEGEARADIYYSIIAKEWKAIKHNHFREFN